MIKFSVLDRPTLVLITWLGTISTLMLAVFIVYSIPPLEWKFANPQFPQSNSSTPMFKTILSYEIPQGVAHAPAILRENDGSARIIWFEGSNEGARDVDIVGMHLKLQNHLWLAEQKKTVLTAQMISDALDSPQTIVTLGNTLQLDPGQTDSLLATISIGGWSLASIAHLEGLQNATVEKADRLNLSPFFNRSHLVRSPTIRMQNGDIGLPAYFEMGNTMSEFVRLTPAGRIVARRRITQNRPGIQPLLVPFDHLNAIALMRNNDSTNHLVASWTQNGGDSWSTPEFLNMPNRDAPVAAIALSENSLLMAHNPSADDTYSIALSISDDRGHSWREIALIEHPGTIPITDMRSIRYPMMMQMDDGSILLTYSFGSKTGIRAHIFNTEWLQRQ